MNPSQEVKEEMRQMEELHVQLRNARVHKCRIFTIRSKRGELFMFASLSLVFGFKAPAYHKSQILHDTAEIALSKMQSAKAASSADELLQLRGRQ